MPEQAERWPLHQGTMSVSGNGFWPNETILVRVDGDYEWTMLANASGAYDTSRPYGPTRACPRRAYMTGLTSGIQAEAWFTSDESG
jgi:hypothetical protein